MKARVCTAASVGPMHGVQPRPKTIPNKGAPARPAVGRHELIAVDARSFTERGRVATHGQPVFAVARPDGRHVWEYSPKGQTDLAALVKSAAVQVLPDAKLTASEQRAVAGDGARLVTTLTRHPGGASVQVHARSEESFTLVYDAVGQRTVVRDANEKRTTTIYDANANAQVATTSRINPNGNPERNVTLLDHAATTWRHPRQRAAWELAAASLHRMHDRTRRDELMQQLARLQRKGFETSILLYGPGVTLGVQRGFPKIGDEAFPGHQNFNNQITKFIADNEEPVMAGQPLAEIRDQAHVRGHLGLEIVCGDLRTLRILALLARKRLIAVVVEEEGHMRELLRLCYMRLRHAGA